MLSPLTFQVEALQEGIARLRSDIKEAKGRGEEKERQQREQVIQGDTEEFRKPPVDSDLGCSVILTGQ